MKIEAITYVVVVAITLSFPAGYYLHMSGHFESEAKKTIAVAKKGESAAAEIEQGEAEVDKETVSAMLEHMAASDRALSQYLSGYGEAMNKFSVALLFAGLAQAAFLAGLYFRKRG